MKKVRQSNFELMRIVSMFFIVIWHFFVHGDIWVGTHGITNHVCSILSALFLVHVNSFILLTGYFNYDKEFKLSKVIKLNNQMWFYRALAVIIFVFCLSYPYAKIDILHMLSPIPRFDYYWFLLVYMLLYIFSPLLNTIIKNSSKDRHKKIILALFIISVLSYLTLDEFFDITRGYSVLSFIMLYFIGSYLHKYPIEKSNMFKSFSKNKIILLSIFLYVFLAIVNMLLNNFGSTISNIPNSIVQYYSKVILDGYTAYSNPLIIIGAISYFIFFSQLEIKSKVINFFSKHVLGVYLITENVIFRVWMYKFLGYGPAYYTYKDVLIAFGYSVLVMLGCILIEFIRSLIFKFFYKRKISDKIR